MLCWYYCCCCAKSVVNSSAKNTPFLKQEIPYIRNLTVGQYGIPVFCFLLPIGRRSVVYSAFFCLVFNNHIYSLAQLVRAVTLSEAFWTNRGLSPVSSLLPPGICLHFCPASHRVQLSHFFTLFMLVGLHRLSPTHALALSARRCVRKSP